MMARVDTLGLRRMPGGLMLPATTAAMVLLAALALAAVQGTAALARHWQQGASALATVQVPRPAQTLPDAAEREASRRDRALAALRDAPGVLAVTPLGEAELADLLRPWLGTGADAMSLPMPAVISLRLAADADTAGLRKRLEEAVPGAAIELHDAWVRRISRLARSLQLCALAALVLVGGIGAAVVAIATRAGLSARRDSVHIVHGLGATDGFIALRFAGRATLLTLAGGIAGAGLAAPMVIGLASLAVPLLASPAAAPEAAADWARMVPPLLWAGLASLPVAAAAIGFATAWLSVQSWLRGLP